MWARPRFLVMGMICSTRLHLLPVPSSLPVALQPLLNQCFPLQESCLAPVLLAHLFQGSCWVWKLVFLLFFGDTCVLISCPGTHLSSISPVLMAAHGSSASYLQGSALGGLHRAVFVSTSGRGMAAFTCICLLGLLLPPQMPQPSGMMPAETQGRIILQSQDWGLARAVPTGQGGWVISQAEQDSRWTQSLSITGHILLTETMKNTGGSGEKERMEQARCWQKQWLPALSLLQGVL